MKKKYTGQAMTKMGIEANHTSENHLRFPIVGEDYHPSINPL
jgi:hypothetical protein